MGKLLWVYRNMWNTNMDCQGMGVGANEKILPIAHIVIYCFSQVLNS